LSLSATSKISATIFGYKFNRVALVAVVALPADDRGGRLNGLPARKKAFAGQTRPGDRFASLSAGNINNDALQPQLCHGHGGMMMCTAMGLRPKPL
jgi:hypothetical protein